MDIFHFKGAECSDEHHSSPLPSWLGPGLQDRAAGGGWSHQGHKGRGCLGLRALGQAHVIVPRLQGIKVNGSRPLPRWRWCLIVLNGCFSFITLSNCFS